MINFRLIIACNVGCILSMLLSYNSFLKSEFYNYTKSRKHLIFPPLGVIFSLYICGYIFLFKGISVIHTRYRRDCNELAAYYILQMSINLSFFIVFYELHMVRLTIAMSTFSICIIVYFIYLWKFETDINDKYVLFYLVTSYINSLLYYYIMRSKLNNDYKKYISII
ncbi:SWPV2-ORF298 [Shearwaterpox virus]|uniref:SWPV2-ORF298 n=1 Tax=Shearwaterpox virus TaxID=1974596 RepID=A0A1V0QGR1_CNPV|nr:SWPV2-ORF298 [Shearwaterpox virus]QRI43029.1 hypothetical protein ChPV311 [Cheloniid poxvirus 1]QRM15591.1 hypothetical protein [Mudlarkpox virus]QRM15944.1 hypothetical protein [Penguinpox virus 2]QRM16281.1 hypothetical protein [Albatrosspox virus]